LPPLLIGAVLRFHGLAHQVLGGDELHAVRVALSRPLRRILKRYSTESDHCIPLTALLNVLAEAGVHITELITRAPVLLAGMALIYLLTRRSLELLGSRTATPYAWLCACSPLLVLYSRIARSYMPMLFLAYAAAFAFYAWLSDGRKRDALTYALCAALAAYFHFLSIVFVLAPFLFALLEGLVRKRPRSYYLKLGALMGLTAVLLTALFLPLLPSLSEFVAEKAKRGSLGFHSVWETLRLQSGSFFLPMTIALFGLAVLGGTRLAQRERRLFLFFLFLSAIHVTSVIFVSPISYENRVTFNRYMLILHPLLLLLIAHGLGAPWWSKPTPGQLRIQSVAASCAVLVFFAAGPLAHPKFHYSSFTHHNRFLAFTAEDFTLPEALASTVPEFYNQLAGSEAEAILEYPISWLWRLSNIPYYYQDIHRKEVLVSKPIDLYSDPRIELRNSIRPDPDAFLASRADFLVVHRDVSLEEEPFRPSASRGDKRSLDSIEQARRLAGRLGTLWGKPHYRDERIIVWDLRTLRED